MPDQGLRKKTVRQKLSPIGSELINRNVLLVDDSIVRGTTSSQIITMAREAGAKRVYIASAAPPVLFPNVVHITRDASHTARSVQKGAWDNCDRFLQDALESLVV